MYPYTQLREIQRPEDCRRAVIDETQALEDEFGQATVQPLYDLIWVLSCGAGVTSHVVVARPHVRSPFDWAKTYVAAAVIILSRHPSEHFDKDACMNSVDELVRIITAQAPTRNFTGWYLSVGPCNVIFTREMSLTTFRTLLPGDTMGYGCQIVVGGAASNRRTAATRWSQAVAFVTSAIRRTQHNANMIPAMPHRHILPQHLT